ncbi:D-alanyl-D-alanine carboxypeptidase/D-alanyl-D-alanine-endopeptidase [candidate division KSB1 bacterium]|nr:D-alanyl-D-alanine carboxypeptidase/D-alanyl-D-alanine-endopeptidase [candidate division KSB1 bacterium]
MQTIFVCTRYLVLLSWMSVIIGCAHQQVTVQPAPAAIERLHHDISTILTAPAFYNAHWGVAIQSLQTGEYVYLQNEDKGFMPASNLKLFTTALALVKLGPDFTFCTDLIANGQIDSGGRLLGDLVIRGAGDPSLGSRYRPNSDEKVGTLEMFKRWAEALKKRKIKVITGNIVGDDNCFADKLLGQGWSWDDESEWYAAQISGLSFNDNCIDLYFTPADSAGQLAKFHTFPETDYVMIINQVQTVLPGQQASLNFSRQRGANQITVSGSVELNGGVVKDWCSIENPTLFCATILKQVLEQEGIKVTGQAMDIDDLSQYRYPLTDSTAIITCHHSPPVSRLIRTINKVSQNLWAEMLLRIEGFKFHGLGDESQSISVMTNYLEQLGIDPSTIGIYDGSGLSRLNLVSPRQVLTLLRALYRHPHFQYFYDSLPIGGVDGTLKSRMQGTAAQNNVHAKTGYINRVRALSGYLKSRDDEPFAFSLITNNYTVPTSMANAIQDLICERLANFTRR